MANTNFVEINPSTANAENDATYQADSFVTGGAATNAFWDSPTANKFFIQASRMMAALARMMVGKGFSPEDGTTPFTAAGSPSTAVTNLATVLSNILTTADRPIFHDAAQHTHTGDTTQDTISTLGPTAGISASSVVRITGAFKINAQGSGTTLIQCTLNSQQVTIASINSSAVTVAFRYELLITQFASGTLSITVTLMAGSTLLGSSLITVLLDTLSESISTLTATITASNANNSDSQQFNLALMEVFL